MDTGDCLPYPTCPGQTPLACSPHQGMNKATLPPLSPMSLFTSKHSGMERNQALGADPGSSPDSFHSPSELPQATSLAFHLHNSNPRRPVTNTFWPPVTSKLLRVIYIVLGIKGSWVCLPSSQDNQKTNQKPTLTSRAGSKLL